MVCVILAAKIFITKVFYLLLLQQIGSLRFNGRMCKWIEYTHHSHNLLLEVV